MLDVVIPNYKGSALLERYLPALIETSEPSWRITVVDDASKDESVQLLRNKFPSVEVLERKENGGFSAAVNDGIGVTRSELVLLLNNDVAVEPGFIDAMVPLFEDASVFAVSPRILTDVLGGIDDGAKRGIWNHGLLWTDHASSTGNVAPTLYTNGCAAVYRRSMLHELGGFSPAYSPFYYEDADLGYRAWKRGWRSLHQPASTVRHEHSATISKLRNTYAERITARNHLFFIWRNIEDRRLIASHRIWLPAILAKKAIQGKRAYLRGYADAYARKREARAAREVDASARVLSDVEIFATAGVEVSLATKPTPD